jgi:hypothetical protein
MNCLQCNEDKKIYLSSLCFDCAMVKAHDLEDDLTPDEMPLLFFERDLDTGLAAGRELATKGYALLPDGYWMMTCGYQARLSAQMEHVLKLLSQVRASESWSEYSKLEASVAELRRLLPGGAK